MFSVSDLADLRADLIAAGASGKDATLAAKDIGHSVWCFGEGRHFFGGKCNPLPDMKSARSLAKVAREKTLNLISATETLEKALEEYMPFALGIRLSPDQPPLLRVPAKGKERKLSALLEVARDDAAQLGELVSKLPSGLKLGRRAPDSYSGLMFMQCAWAWKRSTDDWPSRGVDKVNRSEPKAPLHRNIVALLKKQTGRKPRGVGTACYVSAVTTMIETTFPFPLEYQMFGRQ